MDPISQGTLGASAAQSFSKKINMKWAILIGCLSGMAPDLDILIRSNSDPMVYYQFHRHFTHSLTFIPIGSLLVSVVLHLFLRKKIDFKTNYFFSFLGYATHGLLDACTSYGTQLFWPFSDYRVAWNNVSIIDPLFTLPILAFVLFSLFKKEKNWSRIGIAYALFYLLIGVWQNKRAEEAGYQLAKERGHNPVRLVAKPSFGNLILWRIVYEYDDYFYTDAIRLNSSTKIFNGEKVKKLNLQNDFPWISESSQHFKDIEKFKWFSLDFLAIHPDYPDVIGDMRYSLSPDSVSPLWGIKVFPGKQEQHVESVNFRSKSLKDRGRLLKLLFAE